MQPVKYPLRRSAKEKSGTKLVLVIVCTLRCSKNTFEEVVYITMASKNNAKSSICICVDWRTPTVARSAHARHVLHSGSMHTTQSLCVQYSIVFQPLVRLKNAFLLHVRSGISGEVMPTKFRVNGEHWIRSKTNGSVHAFGMLGYTLHSSVLLRDVLICFQNRIQALA